VVSTSRKRNQRLSATFKSAPTKALATVTQKDHHTEVTKEEWDEAISNALF
jgi:hypothetical protein